MENSIKELIRKFGIWQLVDGIWQVRYGIRQVAGKLQESGLAKGLCLLYAIYYIPDSGSQIPPAV